MNKVMRLFLFLLFLLTLSYCLYQLAQTSTAASAATCARYPQQTLILDAGHGGEDGGAVSLSGVPESGTNLSIVLKVSSWRGCTACAPS